MNFNLLHFKNEPYQNYQNYIYDVLDMEGCEIVDKLLSGFSEFSVKGISDSMEHIKRRHFELTETEMIEKTLETGQKQGIFAIEYESGMDQETFKDMMYSALYELTEDISKQFVDAVRPFRDTFVYDAKCCIGYGIDKDFNLSKTNKIEIALKVSDDPFSTTGFEISTAYPAMEKSAEVIKSMEVLKKEYGISEKQMSVYRAKRKFRENIKESRSNFMKEKENEKMMGSMFSSR